MIELLVILVMLNLALSVLNAWSVGRAWTDSKVAGGFIRFVVWCGVIMAVAGFTWVYLIVEAAIAYSAGWLDGESLEAMLNLGYLILIFPILGSGLGITIHSWLAAVRHRSFGSVATAGWNTFAQGYNTYRALSNVPSAFEKVADYFGGSKGKGGKGLVVIALVLLALVLGVLTTYVIVRGTASSHAFEIERQLEQARRRAA